MKQRSAYQAAMWEALLAGFYIPELESLWFKQSDFSTPHIFIHDFGH